MSYALEFYSLSWDTLKTALSERKRELVRAIAERQWERLLEGEARGLAADRDDDEIGLKDTDLLFEDALDEIAEAMAERQTPGLDPPDVSDNAALVLAAFVRHLGTPVGGIAEDQTVTHDPELQLAFREALLDGVVGACYGDLQLGERLAARPLFGLFHLDFLAWGGLTKEELAELAAKYRLTDATKRGTDWEDVADHVEAWLAAIVKALDKAAKAERDLVTLYFTSPHHEALREKLHDALHDELIED
ncbi:MAG TPA: hypothetical protein VMU06_15575 [Stellaceae bacterium]|nr:hypothetical protein [Stellaceae bacterium]